MHPNPPLPKFIAIPLTVILIVVTIYYWINHAIEDSKYPPATEIAYAITDKVEYASKGNLVLTVKNDLSKSIYDKDCDSFVLEQKDTKGIWVADPSISICGWKPGFSKASHEIKRSQSANYTLILGKPGIFRIKFTYKNNCRGSGCANGGSGRSVYSNEFIVK